MTYSLHFRRKVLSVREKEGLTVSEVASRFNVGIASVGRWLRKLEPCLTRNKPATKIDMNDLMSDVEKYPDAYQYERAERLGVSRRCVCDALKRLNVSYKKNTVPSKKGRRRTAYILSTDSKAQSKQ